MSKQLPHDKFLERVKLINPNLSILENYVSAKTKILVKDDYGYLRITSECLLHSAPSINSAVNKTAYWIEMAKGVHGNRYDYSMSEYKSQHAKIEIICRTHGSFWQTPGNHSQFGCEKCARETCHGCGPYSILMAERNKEAWMTTNAILYNVLLNHKDESFNKIGISTQRLSRRLSSISVYKYTTLEEINVSLYDAIHLESMAHKLLKKYSYIPKHKFSGYKECFLINGHTPADVLERIKALYN